MKLTMPQTAVLIINYMLATAILVLPRTAVQEAGTPDIWICVLLSGLLSLVFGLILSRLSGLFPGETVYQYAGKLIGRWPACFFGTVMVVYFMVISALEARSLQEITSKFLLEGTPGWAIVMPFLWVGAYLVLGGIQPISRAFDVIFPITGLIFLAVMMLSVHVVDLHRLLPVMGQGPLPVLKGMKATAFAFSGPEIMLILVAFMQKPKSAGKAFAVAVGVVTLFYLIDCVMTVGTFSIDGVTARTWPTIDLMRSFELPGLLFERYESLILAIWIMKFFSTYALSYYASSLGLSQLFRIPYRTAVFIQLPFLFLINVLPAAIEDVFKIWDLLSMAGTGFILVIAVILLGIAALKGIKHAQS